MSQSGIPENTRTACVICQRWERTPFFLRHTTPTTVLDTETAMVVGFWICSRGPKDVAPRLCERHSTYLFQLDATEEARLLHEKAQQDAANPAAIEFQRRAAEIAQRLSTPNPVQFGPPPTPVAAPAPAPMQPQQGQPPPLTTGMLGPVPRPAPPPQPTTAQAPPGGFRSPVAAGLLLAELQPARVAPGSTQAPVPAPAPPGPVAAPEQHAPAPSGMVQAPAPVAPAPVAPAQAPAPVAGSAPTAGAPGLVPVSAEAALQAYVQPPTPGQIAGTEPGTFVVPMAGVAPPDADTRPKFPCPLGCGRMLYSGQTHDCDHPDAPG